MTELAKYVSTYITAHSIFKALLHESNLVNNIMASLYLTNSESNRHSR